MKTVGLDDFCNYNFLSNITYNMDGSDACFVLSKADKKNNKYDSYIYNYSNGNFKQITALGKENNFIYFDNETLLFKSNREKDKDNRSLFYKISLRGGEAKLAYDFPIDVSKVFKLDNDDLLLLGSTIPGFEKLHLDDEKYNKEYLDFVKENEDYEEVNTIPFYFNGAGFTKGIYSSLYLYEHKTKKITRLSKLGIDVSEVSVKGNLVYYCGLEVEKISKYENTNLYCLDLKSKVNKVVYKHRKNLILSCYCLAESFIYLYLNDKKYGLNTDGDFYRLDYKNNKLSKIVTYGYSIGSSVGSDVRLFGGRTYKCVGDTLYFISTQFNSAYLFKLEGKDITKITKLDGSVDCFDVYEDSILLIGLFNMELQEIYDGNLNKLSNFNTLKNTYVAKPEVVKFNSGNTDVYGFVLKPYDYKPNKTYPVILDIHGGPKTVYGEVFYHEMQYWAGLGYYVVYCNPKGSDGRKSFMDIMGQYGKQDYKDIMKFMDVLLNRYHNMDRSHLYETGGSYGGYMTNWIIGHTNRFRACASQRSISNWVSFYGTSDIGPDFTIDQNKADPFKSMEKLWDRSPLKYADKVLTPTLFIHSFEDYRCPIEQGYQMYSALLTHGIDTKMVLFKGENHELSRSGKPLHRIKRLDEITKWFIKHK